MAQFDTKITLYDLPTALPDNQPVSPVTSLVRYALNYRQLSFSTYWTSGPKIEADAIAAGASPTSTHADTGKPRYTVPFIVDSTTSSTSPVVVSDSLAIIQYLDITYPDPERPLLEGDKRNMALHKLAVGKIAEFVDLLSMPMLYHGVAKILQTEEAKAMLRSRLPPNATEIDSAEGRALLSASKEALLGLAKVLDEQRWFGGNRPVYEDFALLGYLNFVRYSRADVWDILKEIEGGRFERMVEDGKEWARMR